MKVSLDPISVNYISRSYLEEYKAEGLIKPTPLDKAMEHRQNLKDGKVLFIERWKSEFENYVLEQEAEVDKFGQPTSRAKEYMLIADGTFYSDNRYISSEDYQRIRQIVTDFSPDLEKYTTDFVLMVIYAQNNCFKHKDKYVKQLKSVISYKQREEICNFFGLMSYGTNRDIPDIKKISVSYEMEGKKQTLKIDTPLLMRMMLFEFGNEYYPFVERADKEHWQEQVMLYTKKPKRGKKKSSDSRNIKSLIKAYLDFTIAKGIFNADTPDCDKYLLIGRSLTIAGLEEYIGESNTIGEDAHKGYIGEADFYHKRISRRLGK